MLEEFNVDLGLYLHRHAADGKRFVAPLFYGCNRARSEPSISAYALALLIEPSVAMITIKLTTPSDVVVRADSG